MRQDLPNARITSARANADVLVGAVRTYAATCGQLPDSLEALTTGAPVGAAPCGPFLRTLPAVPQGWTAWAYDRRADGSFTITASGDSTTVRVP
ncbi:MAG TPA: hypothetical protein VFN71_10435 [Methylomirabilota bacterium]|nr:hypothetical protein [Methylomirabilota bacterium]